MAKYNTVVFDLDGTLLDTLADLTDSVNHVLSGCGYPQRSTEEIRSFVGNGVRKLMKRAIPEELDAEGFETALSAFKTYYTSHCRIKTMPYDGIPVLLRELKERGLRLAIVSNKNDAAVKALRDCFFADLIDIAIGQREGIPVKPAPDMVEIALEQLGSAKAGSVYVGDSLVDKETAERAGIDGILVGWGFGKKQIIDEYPSMRLIEDPVILGKYLF